MRCQRSCPAVLFAVVVLWLQSVPDSLGCNGTALKLNSVWWLDISGEIVGTRLHLPPCAAGVVTSKYQGVWGPSPCTQPLQLCAARHNNRLLASCAPVRYFQGLPGKAT